VKGFNENSSESTRARGGMRSSPSRPSRNIGGRAAADVAVIPVSLWRNPPARYMENLHVSMPACRDAQREFEGQRSAWVFSSSNMGMQDIEVSMYLAEDFPEETGINSNIGGQRGPPMFTRLAETASAHSAAAARDRFGRILIEAFHGSLPGSAQWSIGRKQTCVMERTSSARLLFTRCPCRCLTASLMPRSCLAKEDVFNNYVTQTPPGSWSSTLKKPLAPSSSTQILPGVALDPQAVMLYRKPSQLIQSQRLGDRRFQLVR